MSTYLQAQVFSPISGLEVWKEEGMLASPHGSTLAPTHTAISLFFPLRPSFSKCPVLFMGILLYSM